MEIKIGIGIENLFFGMKQTEIKCILGEPNKINEDEMEDGIVYYYNDKMIKLKFDKEEDYKLNSIEVHNQEIKLFNQNIFRKTKCEIEEILESNGYFKFEYEEYTTFDTLFCEEIWTTFVFEFDKLMNIEFSPLFNDNDERIWPQKR